MVLKRNTFEFICSVDTPRTARSRVADNDHPRLWEGEPLKQLLLPTQFLRQALKHRVADNGKAVTPSNLSDARARMKARKQNVG
jgi:hypothetical protein